MLAYVFWHRRGAGVEARAYEEMLARFHQQLADHPTPGFLGSAAFHASAAPWLPGHEPAYEDWYLVDGSAALDPLNDGAVTAPRRDDHDRVAERAGHGAGGLYRLRRGTPDLNRIGFAAWFPKPAGMSYDQLYEALEPVLAREHAALWGRQMVLGPAPEFCLQAEEPVEAMPQFAPLAIVLERVFPGRV